MLTLQRHTAQYLTISNLFNVLFVSLALLEFYQPDVGSNLFAEAKKKKVLVVKHVGMGYKKVPVYKKVPYKILKVEIKKKKSKKPWKKWFKKQMIVKIPHEHKHHGHHHAASEGHQTWALPAFISAPSSMGEIMEAWPTDAYSSGSSSGTSNSNQKQTGSQQQQQTAANSPVQSSVPAPPTSISDLKSIGSEMYPSAYLAEAAAQLVQGSQFAYPQQAVFDQQQQQQQQEINAERANRLRSLLSDSSELKQLLGLPSTISNIVEVAPPQSLAANGSPMDQTLAALHQQAAASNLSLNLAPMVLASSSSSSLSALSEPTTTTNALIQSNPPIVANVSAQPQLKR